MKSFRVAVALIVLVALSLPLPASNTSPAPGGQQTNTLRGVVSDLGVEANTFKLKVGSNVYKIVMNGGTKKTVEPANGAAVTVHYNASVRLRPNSSVTALEIR